MSLYDRENETHLEYERRHKLTGARIQAKFDAEDKARDPLAFYWKKGVINMRSAFNLLGWKFPQPEDFIAEGQYND